MAGYYHGNEGWDDLLAGRYRILSPLGAGGMGEVFLAEDTRLEAAARRAGHHGALGGPILRFLSRSGVAAASLYLGAIDDALEHLAAVVSEQPADHWLKGLPEGNRFAAMALAERADAEALIPALLPWLPVAGRRHVEGAYCALETLVTGLAVMADRERLAGLYSLTLANVQNGRVYTSAAADAAHRARGRAMGEAALTDFRGLEMVLHANRAERFLRES